MYTPLLECLTIKNSKYLSDITNKDELGLFAKEDIKNNINLGITHVKDNRFENGYIRTPLGGFFNHIEKNPNCIVVYIGDFRMLVTLKDIKKGEELLVTYNFYNPSKT